MLLTELRWILLIFNINDDRKEPLKPQTKTNQAICGSRIHAQFVALGMDLTPPRVVSAMEGAEVGPQQELEEFFAGDNAVPFCCRCDI
jgi:hypothetical protein